MDNETREAAWNEYDRNQYGDYSDVTHEQTFTAGFDAGAASVDRTAIEWEFKKVRKMVEDTIPAHHRTGPAGVVYAAMVAAMDAVLETMEEGE